MKKNLVLALTFVFVMAITCTAFAAANPFSDVPAKHWAYPAVAQLQKAGIVDGYGDGTYRGDRLATRYEMAQITAKAMARSEKADAAMKALIDKMAVEFAAELNNLGVRVAKLEKNASSIKFSGDSRIRYFQNADWLKYDHYGHTHSAYSDGNANENFQQRIRIYMASDLNEKTSFFGALGVQNRSGEYGTEGYTNKAEFIQGYFTFKDIFSYGSFQIGRMPLRIGSGVFPLAGVVANTIGLYDSAKITFGKVLKGWVAYGDISASGGLFDAAKMTNQYSANNIFAANLQYPINSKWNIMSYYVQYNSDKVYTKKVDGTYGSNYYPDRELWGWGFEGKMGDFTLIGDYVVNNHKYAASDNKAWWSLLMWKGADVKKPGTWGLWVDYRDFGTNVIDSQTSGFDTAGSVNDKKGWGWGANWTVVKNVVFTAHIESLKKKSDTEVKYAPMVYLRTEYWF